MTSNLTLASGPAARRPMFARALLPALACLLALSMEARAVAPVLYARPGLQSPVSAGPDDLLMLAGTGLGTDNVVVYRALTDTTLPLGTVSAVPTTNTATQGVATLASTADAPYSLTLRLPSVMTSGQSYGLWVRNRQGEWSAGIRINDARPQWISPTRVYATATASGIGRYLKVIGRNLQPVTGTRTSIRLRGPSTFLISARDDGNPATAYETYVAEGDLPAALPPGNYAVDVNRDGSSWVTVDGQALTVLPDPAPAAQFPLTKYGNCLPNDDSDDSSCIAAAIAAAAAAGGGDVVFPEGTWMIINGAERAGVETNNGLVVPVGVNLAGSGAANATVIRRDTCWQRPVWFSLLGRNTVRNLTFRDDGTANGALCNGLAALPTTALQLGKVWYTVSGTAPTVADDITITRNVFDKPWRALRSGGLPSARLQVTQNVFGAWHEAIFLSSNRNNLKTPFGIDDAIIANNKFMPGSFIDVANGQGTMATSLGSARRLDFSGNLADGAATTYLNAPTDPKGWRAGYFWDLSGPQEQLLLARNTATCTGDKVGDGEAFAYDNNHNTFALPAARSVTAASASGLTIPGPLQSVQEGVDITPVLASYYVGHWLRIVDGPGQGQSRRISGYSTDTTTGLVTFTVAPAWDVPPVATQSRVTIARQFWQAYLVDNLVDHRQPLCQKSNATAPEGGAISLWAQSSDSTVDSNRQYDTDGIGLKQSYGAGGDPACPTCKASNFFQSALEIRGNLIDGEYDWNSACSLSGFRGWASASQTPSSLPPVISFGTTVSYNTYRHVDGLKSGALELSLGSWGGPSPGGWRMVENTLIHHNRISDVVGAPPAGTCNGVNHYAQLRTGINLDTPAVWRSVLYANTCTNDANRLNDRGTATVRVCPAGATTDSCECLGAPSDLAVSGSVAKVAGTTASYRYTVVVTNPSNVSAEGIQVSADVLPGVTVTSLATSIGSCQANVNTCTIGTLPPGGSATLTLGADLPLSQPTITFSATTSTGDANVVNNGVQLKPAFTLFNLL